MPSVSLLILIDKMLRSIYIPQQKIIPKKTMFRKTYAGVNASNKEGITALRIPTERKNKPDITAGKRLILFFCGINIPSFFLRYDNYILNTNFYQGK
jgi:hypothetical protein